MTFNPSYITKSRHGIYYLRYPLPKSFHPQGKCDYIKLSLQTYVKHEALAYVDVMRYAGRVIIQRLQRVDMRYIEKKKIIADYFAKLLEQEKQSMLDNGALSADDAYNRQVLAERLSRHLKKGVGTKGILSISELEDICKDNDIEFSKNTDEGKQLIAEYMKAVVKHNEDVLVFNKRIASPDYFDAPQVAMQGEGITIDATVLEVDESMAQVMAKYFKEHDDVWADSTKRDYRAYRNLLLDNIDSSKALNAFTVEMSRNVKDVVGVMRNSATTKNKYLSFYKQFFIWCENNGYTERRFFSGMLFKEERDKEDKQAFTMEQLILMQERLISNKAKLKIHNYWSVLIGMYTGARLYEITQLHAEDIKQVDGIWVFEVNDTHGLQKLKNKHSRRHIPIHSKLVELGLLKYVKQVKSGHLFPELSYCRVKKNYHKNVGRWFNSKLLVDIDIKTPLVDFHSLRRSMSTLLMQSDVEEAKVSSIFGHKREGMTQRYNTGGYTVKQLQTALECFKFDYDGKG